MCRSCESNSHPLSDVPIAKALADLRCGMREDTAAGNLDSAHPPKPEVVGRKKPVAPCVVRTRARPTGYQNPRAIFSLAPRPALRRGYCQAEREDTYAASDARAPLRKRCASKGAAPKEGKTAARTTCVELRCLVCEAPVLEPVAFTLASLSSPPTQKKGLQNHVGPGGESKPNQCVSPLPSVTYWIEPALNHLRKDLICVVHTSERRLIFFWLLSTLTTPVPGIRYSFWHTSMCHSY